MSCAPGIFMHIWRLCLAGPHNFLPLRASVSKKPPFEWVHDTRTRTRFASVWTTWHRFSSKVTNKIPTRSSREAISIFPRRRLTPVPVTWQARALLLSHGRLYMNLFGYSSTPYLLFDFCALQEGDLVLGVPYGCCNWVYGQDHWVESRRPTKRDTENNNQ